MQQQYSKLRAWGGSEITVQGLSEKGGGGGGDRECVFLCVGKNLNIHLRWNDT